MQFTINALNRCDGGNHIFLTLTLGGGTHTFTLEQSDLDLDPPDNLSEAREMIMTRLRSAIKEAGATTPAQIRIALLNKTFKV